MLKRLFIAILFILPVLVTGCFPEAPYDFVPTENATFTMGSPTRYWSAGYFSNLTVDNLTIGGATVGADNVTGAGTAGRMVQWGAPGIVTNATNTNAQVSAAVAASHAQNTDTHLTSDGTTIVIDAGVIMRDLYTDRWAYNNSNTFFGIDVAGAGNLTDAGGGADATANTAYGNNTVKAITTGYFNTAIGHYALTNLTTGNFNTAVGELSQGYLTSGQFNTSVGVQSLLYGNGNYNTAIGQWAGENCTGDRNVFLGFSAGQNSGAVSDKLYIDNSNTATPLIAGDFATNTVTINTTLSMAGNINMVGGATVDGVDVSTLGAGYANTFTISPSGANYTTIQAALTANATANTLFLVYPGTYTNDTINFTANGQSIKGVGTYAKQIVTSASAAVVDFGAYTGCSVTDMTVRVTAATSAIATVNGSTGTIFLYDSAVEMTNSNVATVAQPCCIKLTGAATVTFINGFLNYTNNVATTAGAGIKTAVCSALNSTTTFRRAAITIAGAGASELIIPIYGESDCTTQFYRCKINVTDLDTTAAIGFSYISGAGGTGENYSNTCHVTCGAGAGHEADGLVAVGTRNVRSMFNYINLTGNTQYPFQVDSGCTVISEFDDIVSTGASLASGTGVLKYINSISDGTLKVSGNISMGGSLNYGADAGASDTYTCTIGGITAYTTGLPIYFKANTVNTGACTINVNGLGAKALKIKGGSSDPENNWIKSGEIVHCVYDGTNFQVLNPDAEP